jgi:hypothetical protein
MNNKPKTGVGAGRKISALLCRRILGCASVLALAVPLALAGSPVATASDDSAAASSSVVLAWQRIALRTIFTEGATPPQVGTLYLAFSSLAVHDAVQTAQERGHASDQAAIATAAHDVLSEYFPTSRSNLDADLTTSLAAVPDGPREAKGIRIGRTAAVEMIASRVDDGRNDTTIVYSKPDLPGIWQPPATGMATAWLGFVRPLIVTRPVPVDGPDPLASAAYAADYNEVRRLGPVTSLDRTQEQTDIARFFASNPPLMYRDALCRYLDTHPLGMGRSARLFARIDAAVADAMIRTFRLKFDIGYWRPYEAVAEAADDNNPDTAPESGWAPLIPNPAYADYTSGHAAATAPFAEVVRRTLGDDTPLVLLSRAPDGSVVATRSYLRLSAIEHDALNARVWGGLHFRDAMDDGYQLGHATANRVYGLLR